MNMRERLARAAYVSQNKDDDWIFHEEDGPVKSEYRAIADAVLDELMTPTEGMIGAGVQVTVDSAAYDAPDEGEVFTAMIKAAKEGK